MCGRLLKSLYGTRSAAANWEEEYAGTFNEMGFIKGIGSPCIFVHAHKDIKIVIHGDDITILAVEEDIH